MNIQHLQSLRQKGRYEEARHLAKRLACVYPHDALVHYEAACIHDYLGFEAEAIPYYLQAITLGLPADQLRSAYLGLGSTYRVLGQYEKAIAVLEQGLEMFPEGREFIVFRAMVQHHLGFSKQAIEALLHVIAETSSDSHIQEYRRAIMFYAQDIEHTGS